LKSSVDRPWSAANHARALSAYRPGTVGTTGTPCRWRALPAGVFGFVGIGQATTAAQVGIDAENRYHCRLPVARFAKHKPRGLESRDAV